MNIEILEKYQHEYNRYTGRVFQIAREIMEFNYPVDVDYSYSPVGRFIHDDTSGEDYGDVKRPQCMSGDIKDILEAHVHNKEVAAVYLSRKLITFAEWFYIYKNGELAEERKVFLIAETSKMLKELANLGVTAKFEWEPKR